MSTRMHARTLEVVEVSPRAFVGCWHDIVITIWRADIAVEDVRSSLRAQERAARHSGRFAALAYVEPAALRAAEPARTEAARVTEAAGKRLLGVAVVLPLEGFHGAIARTVATGVHLLSRSRAPQRVFRSVADAAPWLGERLGRPEAAHAASFQEAVDEARARTI